MTTSEPDDPGRVNVNCPACGQGHTVVWPRRNPDALTITCGPCGDTALTVTRDGEVTVDG